MKRKIMLGFTGVISAAIVITAVLMAALCYRMVESRVYDDLGAYAHLASLLIGEGGFPAAADGSLRVTLIDADGNVAYDSVADSSRMESHADRPEVLDALQGGEGRAVRRSETMDKSTYYYALRLGDGAVLRVAQVSSNIWSIFRRAAPLMMLAGALMVGLCIAMANLLTRRLIAPIEQMTQHLGDAGGVASYPELAPFMNMIRSQHEEILRSAEMRVEFTANVTHELKTPLTSISGYAELIESGMAQGEEAKRFAGGIRKSADRLLTLINDIIRLSQMDAPEQEICMETLNLAQVAENAAELLRGSAERMNVDLQVDARAAYVSADRRMMEELVYNLCDNAIRYNVHGGSVLVSVHQIRGQVVLCVQDTGIGISKENQEHIFERFYRVDKSRSKATGGTGLGLAIVKHIAAKHHAQIGVESEPGVGTTITVRFERGAA